MIARKTLPVYTNLFSPNDYKKNEQLIYKSFKNKNIKRKCKPCFLTKKQMKKEIVFKNK